MLKQPDLSDNALWKQRFRTPSIAWLQIASRNPARGLICSNRDGAYQLYAWLIDTGGLTRLTGHPSGVTLGAISADGETVYYLHDAQGDNIGHYFTIPFAGGESHDLTPTMTPYTSYHIAECASGRLYGFMALNQEGFQIYAVDAENAGTPHIRYESESMCIGPLLSYNGEITLIATTEKAQNGALDFSLEAYDTVTGQLMGTLYDADSSIEPFAFSPLPGDFRLIGTSNASGQKRPLIWNPHTGERRDLMLVSLNGDLDVWGWSPDATWILLRQSYRAEHRLYTYDLENGLLHALKHPEGVIQDAAVNSEGHIAALWQNAAHPPQIIELDGTTGEQKRVLLSEDSPTGHQWQSETFQSGDRDIQCWLGVPEGDGPFPVMIHLHGGPADVQMQNFHPAAQAWLDHGIGFLSINYPGSTTFGDDFERCIHGQIGTLETRAIADGVRWLKTQGIAQADAVFITGASYGGTLALMALAESPDLFAGGIVIDPIVDWTLHSQHINETLRAYTETLFSGTPETHPDAYRNASPITHIDTLNTPLLLFHAENDPRSPVNTIAPFIQTMQAQGKPLETHIYSDTAIDSRIQQQEMMLKFVYRYLSR